MVNEVDAKLHANLGGLKSPGTQNESIGYEDCCLCFCKADSLRYALEMCGHLYCVACVNDLLETSERNKSFQITCCSEGCSSSLVLRDFENLIKSEEQRDQLAEAALSNLVQTNPKLYSYCPSPDCPMVYKVSEPDNAKPFTCPKCLRKTCTACRNDAHVGFESCASWKEYNDNSHVFEWARGKNVRECPKCNNLIEKNGGCMHVSCNCGAHICWRCMKTFSSSDDCYDHLGRCGGIFPGNMDPPVPHPEALQAERGGQPRPFLEMQNAQGAAFQIAARDAVQNLMPRAERQARRVPQYLFPEHGRIGVRDGLPQHQIPEHDRIRVRNERENEMPRAERRAHRVPQYHIPEHGRIGARDGLPQHQIPEHERIRVRNERENEMPRAERQAHRVPQYHIPEHGRIGARDGLPQHQIPEHERIRVRNVIENELAHARRPVVVGLEPTHRRREEKPSCTIL